MIMFALFTEGITPFVPGLAFIPIFALATDIGSLFRVPFNKKDEPAKPADAAKALPASSEILKEKKEKTGNRKKKR